MTPDASDRPPDRPLVSGIIIFLNAGEFIEEAVESVFAQTCGDWELLLVDDGSTDGSSDLALGYAERFPEKVRYLEHPGHENRGMSAARNLGIKHARGEYVAFLDSDDVWLPEKLEDQTGILGSLPGAAMLYGRTLFWHSWTGRPEDLGRDALTELGVEPETLVEPPELLALFLRDESTVASTCSVLIRREVFEEVGGFEDSFRGMYEDMVFYTKLFLRKPVFVSGGCWDRYRQHGGNSNSAAIKSGELYDRWRPNPSRGVFLNWVEAYLSEQGIGDGEVRAVLRKELLPYRHPVLFRLFRALPAPLQDRLRGLWRRRSGASRSRAAT